MGNQTSKSRLVNLCFRTDQILIDIFYQHCKNQNITRSEGFRTIFNDHMILFLNNTETNGNTEKGAENQNTNIK